MSGAHAKLSPSGASIWMNCPGAIAAQEGLPDETSEFAAEGSRAHEISDLCLTFGLSPYDFIGSVAEVEGFTFEWTEEDADYLVLGIDDIRAVGGQFFGERQVDLSKWLGPDQFGTLDRAILLPDLIIIDDLKFGRGVPVSPVENKQLRLYALGFIEQEVLPILGKLPYDFPVLIRIDQPRCSGGGGEWRTTYGELLAFGEEARAAAERTRDPYALRIAGDHCLWCKARKPGCMAFETFAADLIDSKFDDMDVAIAIDVAPRLNSVMTPDRRAYILKHRKLVEDWFEILHAQALDDAMRGLPCGGLKAVEGRKTPDKWHDNTRADAALAPLLGEARFTKKVRSPTQILKELDDAAKADIEPLICRGTKKPALVSEQDARPAILALEQQFDEVEMD
jgi:hypothetical protein